MKNIFNVEIPRGFVINSQSRDEVNLYIGLQRIDRKGTEDLMRRITIPLNKLS